MRSKNVLVIGVDVASGKKAIESRGRSQFQEIHVVAAAAFLIVGGKSFHHFCNHHVAHGNTETVFKDEEVSENETTASGGSQKFTASAAVTKHLSSFVQEALEYFKRELKLSVDSVVIARGSSSDGEIEKARREELEALKSLLQGTPFVHLTAQRTHNTRLMFKCSESLGRGPNVFTNAPRGFITTEGVQKLEAVKSGFLLNGANCTLGQAKAVKYLILHSDLGAVSELPELFYGLCFMFPNKADAIPYPLPLKCAQKYANLFVTLDVNEVMTLHPLLKPKLHYL
jgi:hypothetical protein